MVTLKPERIKMYPSFQAWTWPHILHPPNPPRDPPGSPDMKLETTSLGGSTFFESPWVFFFFTGCLSTALYCKDYHHARFLSQETLKKTYFITFFIVSFFLQTMHFDEAMTRETLSVSQKSEIAVWLCFLIFIYLHHNNYYFINKCIRVL